MTLLNTEKHEIGCFTDLYQDLFEIKQIMKERIQNSLATILCEIVHDLSW